MIKEIAHIVYTNPETFTNELYKNLSENGDMIPEIQYQMSTLPNGKIQYGALILYR
jgi:hypothetical protein